jgi:formiminoglutamate deiminase
VTPTGPPPARRTFFARRAFVGDPPRLAADVVLEVEGDRIAALAEGTSPPPGAARLEGVVLPGFVDAHSHAFQRALRGRVESSAGDFWSWREAMYALADALDPDTFLELASLAYAEMAVAGYTCVGEFHYLHHAPGGIPYEDANLLGLHALEAARQAGLRITLLDACYLSGGADGRAPEGAQRRFADRDGEAWARRVEDLLASVRASGSPTAAVGVAAHSVRAVPPPALATVAALGAHEDLVVHAHLAEQRGEVDECLAAHATTPAALLDAAGLLTPRVTVVHATHLSAYDVHLVGRSRAHVCACSTTEADLADGVAPLLELVEAGAGLCTGSDSHVRTDPFAEARGVELHQRLATGRRGLHRPVELLSAATRSGARALGWDAGVLEPGRLADLVAVRTDAPHLAGAGDDARPEDLLALLLFAGGPADVRDVIVGGEPIVRDGVHRLFGEPSALAARLDAAVSHALGLAGARRGDGTGHP